MSSRLKTEVKKFKNWADKEYSKSDRWGEWECDYPGWSSLYSAFESFIVNTNLSKISQEELKNLIYVIDRDNES